MSRSVNLLFFAGLVVGAAVVPVVSAAPYGPNAPPAGPYSPAAGQPGSTAIANSSPAITEWANSVTNIVRGPQDIAAPAGPLASFGSPAAATGSAEGDSFDVVSLGDGGSITLSFAKPIANGPGADFAVFENSFSDTFLELGFVEVSSDGTHFVRFPAVSLTQTNTQVGGFGSLDPANLYDLAGNFRQGFGTPFDLSELAGAPNLNISDVQYVRVVDVVGRITPVLDANSNVVWSPGTDYYGHVINDPYSTPFASGGFDLDGIGAINTAVPEPASLGLLLTTVALLRRRRRSRSSSNQLV